jgi:hypothetical protein
MPATPETTSAARPAGPAGAPGVPAAAGARVLPRGEAFWLVAFACVVVAALSLLASDRTTYDPTAWLIWGREIIHWDLDTNAGPSWKPLPVLLTTPFALLGDQPAMDLWLVVARTGGLLSLVLAFRLARRLAGPPAGAIAAVGLLIANQYLYNFVRGDSEGLLVAAVLGAIELHLAGRRRAVFWLGVAAALMRPEVWPLLAVYGLLLVRNAPPRERARTAAVVVGAGALVIALWLVPERLGSGDFFRAASRAREPVDNSPAQEAFPFGAVFTHSVKALCWPIYAGAVAAVLLAARDLRAGMGGRRRLAVAGISALLMLEVAGLAQGGFTGNLRYVTLPASLVCVLGGVGWVVAARELRRHGRRTLLGAVAVALAASAALLVHPLRTVEHQTRQVRTETRLLNALPETIERAGGAAAIRACGPVVTGPFQTQNVAWELKVHEHQVGTRTGPTGTALVARGSRVRNATRLPVRLDAGRWVVRSSCPLGAAPRRSSAH